MRDFSSVKNVVKANILAMESQAEGVFNIVCGQCVSLNGLAGKIGGGHRIPVDPYYLVYKARELGYHPQVIMAGRAINDSMPKHVAELAIKELNEAGKVIKGSKALILGLTYKENVPDIRESPVGILLKS